jgi:hypothetical protein
MVRRVLVQLPLIISAIFPLIAQPVSDLSREQICEELKPLFGKTLKDLPHWNCVVAGILPINDELAMVHTSGYTYKRFDRLVNLGWALFVVNRSTGKHYLTIDVAPCERTTWPK